MSLDKKMNKVLVEHPSIKENLDYYASTNSKTAEALFLCSLDYVKLQYGSDVYEKFMHVYRGINEAKEQ